MRQREETPKKSTIAKNTAASGNDSLTDQASQRQEDPPSCDGLTTLDFGKVTEEDIERRVASLYPRLVAARCEEIILRDSPRPVDSKFWFTIMRHCADSEGSNAEIPFFEETLVAMSAHEEPEARRVVLAIAKKHRLTGLAWQLS